MPQTVPPQEDALPKGHPSRFDYDPESLEAKAWAAHQSTLHANSGLPPGYKPDLSKPHGALVWRRGVDPMKPWLEPFTGRDRRGARAKEGNEAE